jgi:thiol-disulfide isomerase/thioredoxin
MFPYHTPSAVHIFDSAEQLFTLLASNTTTPCVLVNFYSTTCPFSARLAPFYNALPRAFPRMFIAALDVRKTDSSLARTRLGIVGTPSILLFHRGKAVIPYNLSDYSLHWLKAFVRSYTDLVPVPNSDVEDADILGPLPAVAKTRRDPWLIFGWCFVTACALFYGAKSSAASYLLELILRVWHESGSDM